MSSIELRPIEPSSAPTLARLMQLYAHDFSEIIHTDVSDEGLFAVPDPSPYFSSGLWHPFFIVAGGHIAGFAIISETSRFGNTDAPLNVAEFFVLRKYRGTGAGRAAAEAAFARFRGRWEVRQVAKNSAATAFWRRVIGRYTGGSFEEEISDDERWRGPVQRFDNRLPGSRAAAHGDASLPGQAPGAELPGG